MSQELIFYSTPFVSVIICLIIRACESKEKKELRRKEKEALQLAKDKAEGAKLRAKREKAFQRAANYKPWTREDYLALGEFLVTIFIGLPLSILSSIVGFCFMLWPVFVIAACISIIF